MWQVIVIFGIQWGMVPIVIANFAQNGCDTIQIFIQIAVIAQMAAAFGVFLKSKDKELKANALSASITAIFGITEPTIYGITLPRKKPFVIASVWAAIGSVIVAILGAVQYVYAGLPGLLSTVNAISPDNPASFPACMIGAAVTMVGVVASIMILGYENKSEKAVNLAENSAADLSGEANGTESNEGGIIFSPLNGEVKVLKEVNDPTFLIMKHHCTWLRHTMVGAVAN